MHLKDKVILVTGGASGLGAAVVRELAGAGARVVMADLAEAPGRALASEIGAAARFIRTDVTAETDGQAAVDLALREFGGLHGLVNCAGVGPAERLLGKQGVHRLDSFVRCLQINLVGTFNLLRLAAAAMARGEPLPGGERGVIVNTASAAAYEGQIGQVAYSASKGGIVAMTLPAARELARDGIRVMTVAPGLFATPMMATLPPEIQAALGASVPFPPRLGDPAEFAATVRHIFENPMLNGEVIRLDGAIRLAPR